MIAKTDHTLEVASISLSFGSVQALIVKEGNTIHVGTPFVQGASITCKVLGRKKADKVIAYKHKRRKSSKKKIGSRQHLTELEVKEIHVGK